MNKNLIIAIVSISLLCCVNSNKKSAHDGDGCSQCTNSKNEEVNYSGYARHGYSSSPNTDRFVTCQMCGGTGMMTYFDGSLMQCVGCNGRGGFTQEDLDRMAEVFIDQHNSTPTGDDENCYRSNSGRSVYEIENDLQRAYDLLSSMESNYDNCTSEVLRTQYYNMILQQNAHIQKLEQELRNAQ